jgi:hypothetical protein
VVVVRDLLLAAADDYAEQHGHEGASEVCAHLLVEQRALQVLGEGAAQEGAGQAAEEAEEAGLLTIRDVLLQVGSVLFHLALPQFRNLLLRHQIVTVDDALAAWLLRFVLIRAPERGRSEIELLVLRGRIDHEGYFAVLPVYGAVHITVENVFHGRGGASC